MSALKPEYVRDSLLVGAFSRTAPLPPPGDPIGVTPMEVEVDRIKCYDGNIRLVPNPKYDEIKLTLQTQGPNATGALPITRRPQEEHYMAAKGHNTRLQIIQTLWRETRDPRFRAVLCLFYPWPGEAQVLADHIGENENRGQMLFIEKALALRTLRQTLEHETGETLTQRDFARHLQDPDRKLGLSVSRTQMQRLEYAAEVLYPLLPEALKAGLGPRHVEQIQQLEARLIAYGQRRGGEIDEAVFRALFGEVLSRHDGPEFHFEDVQRALEVRLADSLGQSLHTVQAGLAALEAGMEIGPVADASEPTLPLRSPGFKPGRDRPVMGAPATATPALPAFRAANPAPPASSPPTHTPAEADLTLASLRAQAYACAMSLAQRHGLGACVNATPTMGLGFWVGLPEHSIAQTPAAALWWMLVGLSEQLVYLPQEGIDHVACMPPNELKELIRAQRLEAIHARVGRHSSWILLPHLLPTTTAPDTEELVQLFRTVQRLRMLGTEADLW